MLKRENSLKLMSDWIRCWIIKYLKSSFESKIYSIFEMHVEYVTSVLLKP